MADFKPCCPPPLSLAERMLAAQRARDLAPHRYPQGELAPAFLAVDRAAWWGDRGQIFGVKFARNTPAGLKKRVLEHANAWAEFANVLFREDDSSPMVRVAFGPGGYWSYVGTGILGVPPKKATMNLEGLTTRTPEEEFRRVVRHEFGHTIGCQHEHLRPELVARIDRRKALAYFQRTQNWDAATTEANVLTSLDERSLYGTTKSDPDSIMCYWIPGEITTDGKPIAGGDDINDVDAAFIATIYPKPAPTNPPPTEPVDAAATEYALDGFRYRVTKLGPV